MNHTLVRLFLTVFALGAFGFARAQTPQQALAPKKGLSLAEVPLHDPYILADTASRTYYLYTSASPRVVGRRIAGTVTYRSKDLLAWEGPFLVFECPPDAWAAPDESAWAPEVHAYKGKYYLFTTLHNSKRPLPTPIPSQPNIMRGTMIAASASPEGPFELLKKEGTVTPPEFMTLDGTLYVDQAGVPWMVYAHEWIQKIDGTIEAIPLKDDLSDAAGSPIHLFKGSDAPWLNEQIAPDAKTAHYVTDGPQLFRTKEGVLLMLWSSYRKNDFGNDGYVETVARSKSGELKGPWEQLQPLVGNDSGHGMLFRTFEGRLMLIVHQPFVRARGKLYEVEDLGDKLRISRYREDLSGPPLGPLPGQTPR